MKTVTFRILLDIEEKDPRTIGVGGFQFSEETIDSVFGKPHPKEIFNDSYTEEVLNRARVVLKAAFDSVERDLFEPLDDKQKAESREIFNRFVATLLRADTKSSAICPLCGHKGHKSSYTDFICEDLTCRLAWVREGAWQAHLAGIERRKNKGESNAE